MLMIATEFEGKTEPDAMIRTWRYSGYEKTLKQMLGEQTLPGSPPPWLLLLDRRTILALERFVSLLIAHTWGQLSVMAGGMVRTFE